jgi:hypothetical protein
VLAVAEGVVVVVSSLVAAGLLALLLFLFVRLMSRTRQVLGTNWTAWLTGIGAVIAIVGVIDLIWTQFSIEPRIADTAQYRWDLASNALIVVALGLLVSIGAQILQAVQSRSLD